MIRFLFSVTSTIREIKTEIATSGWGMEYLKGDPAVLRLRYRSKILEDSLTVASYNIRPESTVLCSIKLTTAASNNEKSKSSTTASPERSASTDNEPAVNNKFVPPFSHFSAPEIE